MSDRSAFERQVEAVLQLAAGSSRPVDASAVVERATTGKTSSRISATTRWFRSGTSPGSTEGGFSMFSALKLVAGGAVLALFGGLLLTVGVLGPADDPTVPAAPAANEDVSPSSGTDGFPTGLFVSTNLDDWFMEYNEDGTARVFIHGANVQVDFEYTVEGDLMTEALDLDDGEPGMTYRWDYDGEILTMDPLGEVSETHPSKVAGRGWRLVPDPAEIVVAAEEVEAGGMVYSTWAVIGIVPGAEAPPDVYLDVADVIGRIAAVPITPGQPITPDMLEPTE